MTARKSENRGQSWVKGEGACTITCSAKDGSGVKAECQVKVFEVDYCPDGNHPHMIDLGLPSGTKWACCNVGAGRPEEFGDYFAWAETEPKDDYDYNTYRYFESTSYKPTKYTGNETGYNGFKDGLSVLLPEDDAATVNWGSNWQTPSADQLEELVNDNYTTCEYMWEGEKYTSYLYGVKITSKINGNSIFMPAAGVMSGTRLCLPYGLPAIDSYDYSLVYGCYMSNELYHNDNRRVELLHFREIWYGVVGAYLDRTDGFTVRAVRKK